MNTLLARLKEHTWDCHRRLEQRLPLFAPGFSREDYRRLLQCFLGVHRPLEALLARQPQLPAHLPDFAARLKTPQLESDLAALGLSATDIAAIPSCPHLPAATELPAAFGCLYVVEGATLGGQVISRYLSKQWQLDVDHGARFFSGYGADTHDKWQTFGHALTATVRGEPAETQALHSARALFLDLERWMEQCGLLQQVTP